MKEVQAISNLDEMTIILKNELENIAEGFVAVGFYLKKTRDDGLYRQKGYADIFEYAKSTFGISRSTATRFMEINDTYSIDGYSPQIEDRYRGYGSSKLTEMLQLPEEIRQEVPKEATVSDIREAKTLMRETQTKYDAQYELCDVAPTPEDKESTSGWMEQLVRSFFEKEGKTTFKAYVIWSKSNKNEEDKTTDILAFVNPSKFRMVRIKTANVLMSADKIKVMPYRDQGAAGEYSYNDFHNAFLEVFYPEYPQMAQSAADAYKEVYGVPLEGKTEEPPKASETAKKETKKPVKTPAKKKEETVPPVLEPDHVEAEPKEGDEERAVEEVIPGQMEVKDYPELLPDGYEEHEIEVTNPYKSRKQYVDGLTQEEASVYMAAVMESILKKMKNTSYAVLLTYNFWKQIWETDVDENGNVIEEG